MDIDIIDFILFLFIIICLFICIFIIYFYKFYKKKYIGNESENIEINATPSDNDFLKEINDINDDISLSENTTNITIEAPKYCSSNTIQFNDDADYNYNDIEIYIMDPNTGRTIKRNIKMNMPKSIDDNLS